MGTRVPSVECPSSKDSLVHRLIRRCLAAFLLSGMSASHAATPTPAAQNNLLAIGSGVRIVQAPAEYDTNWSGLGLIDEVPTSGWASPRGQLGPHSGVYELAARSRLSAIGFDTALVDTQGSAAKRVRVELADAAAGPWRSIGEFTLADATDGQRFAVASPEGRFLRLTILENFGAAEFTELMGVAAFGEFIAAQPTVSVSGTWETDYGKFHVSQQAASIEGCYEHDEGMIENGGIEGRILRFTWHEDGGPDDKGPSLFTFSDDGQSFTGYWWGADGGGVPSGVWNGKRISKDVGSCPHWTPKSNSVSRELAASGRARLYGILFDTDSATIKPESKPALDALVATAKEQPSWKLSIEGHTDSSGNAAHNLDLSQRRADAVKAWLVTAGIAADRLSTAGKGSTVPVADNASAAGRAQNRRVEVARP